MLLWFLRAESADRDERLLAIQLAGDVVVLDDEIAGSLLEIAANDDEDVELRQGAAIALGPGLEEADWAGVTEPEDYDDDEDEDDFEEDEDEEDFDEGEYNDYDDEVDDFDDNLMEEDEEEEDDDDFDFDVTRDGLDEDDLAEASLSEPVVNEIQKTLRRLVMDDACPVDVRRAALEASVRAPQEWHTDAIRGALASNAPEWRVTAVFCMGFVDDFDDDILEALQSSDPRVEFEAVRAAGNRSLVEAWPRVADLVADNETRRELRRAAIEAAPNIYPAKAMSLLDKLAYELADSDDEDLRDTVDEARETCAEVDEIEAALDDEEN
jgi:uncharacterized protein (UPF0147 family)